MEGERKGPRPAPPRRTKETSREREKPLPIESRHFVVTGSELHEIASHLVDGGAHKIVISPNGRVYRQGKYMFTLLRTPQGLPGKREPHFCFKIDFYLNKEDSKTPKARVHFPPHIYEDRLEAAPAPPIPEKDFLEAHNFVLAVLYHTARAKTIDQIEADPLTTFTRLSIQKLQRAIRSGLQKVCPHKIHLTDDGSFFLNGKSLFSIVLGRDGCFSVRRNLLFEQAISFSCSRSKPEYPSECQIFQEEIRDKLLEMLSRILDEMAN